MTDNLKPGDIVNIDLSSRKLGLGNLQSASYALLHGLNTTNALPSLPINTDSQGIVLFTRPNMNLSYDNVIMHRTMTFLADPRPDSIGNYIRCLMYEKGFDPVGDANRSTIINDKLGFMPPLSTLLLTMSEPPDYVADLYTSKSGFGKEEISFIEARPNINSAYDLSLTFANIEGNVIKAIFAVWAEYAARVFEGSMLPFPSNILAHRIDYQTRPYRIILDRANRYVQEIYAPFAAFPYSIPYGSNMGYNAKETFNTNANEIRLNFRAIGAIYNDPRLIKDFNKVTTNFNPDMRPGSRSNLIKVTGEKNNVDLKQLFSYHCYPYINETTYELEWWTERSLYDTLIKLLERPKKTPATQTTTTTVTA